jgi:hypothetical protein
MGRHLHRYAGGRHRYGTAGMVHCRDIEPIGRRLAELRPSLLALFRDQSRHTTATLARRGVRPRPAFVLIASM